MNNLQKNSHDKYYERGLSFIHKQKVQIGQGNFLKIGNIDED